MWGGWAWRARRLIDVTRHPTMNIANVKFLDTSRPDLPCGADKTPLVHTRPKIVRLFSFGVRPQWKTCQIVYHVPEGVAEEHSSRFICPVNFVRAVHRVLVNLSGKSSRATMSSVNSTPALEPINSDHPSIEPGRVSRNCDASP